MTIDELKQLRMTILSTIMKAQQIISVHRHNGRPEHDVANMFGISTAAVGQYNRGKMPNINTAMNIVEIEMKNRGGAV